MTSYAPRRSGPIVALVAFAGIVSHSDAADVSTLSWLRAQARLSSDAPATPAEAVRSNQEMVTTLRDRGLPITAIAEMMGVERKTIYAWLDGSAVRDENAERLSALYQILNREMNGDFRPLYRVWNQAGPNGQVLRNMLSAKNVDSASISETLAALRITMDHYAKTERQKSNRGGNPALDELPVADSG